MVAQSCETVVAVAQWGRTSPFAATTAIEHQQPMDLVKRKPGKSDRRPDDYRSPNQDVDSQQTQLQSKVFDQQRHQTVPHGSQDEAQQPQAHHAELSVAPSLQGWPLQLQEGQVEDDGKQDQLQWTEGSSQMALTLPSGCIAGSLVETDQLIYEPVELNSLEQAQEDQPRGQSVPVEIQQHHYYKLKCQKLPQGELQSKPVRVKQHKQEMLSRWVQDSAQMQQDEIEKIQGKGDVISQQQGMTCDMHFQQGKVVPQVNSTRLTRDSSPLIQVSQTNTEENELQNEISPEIPIRIQQQPEREEQQQEEMEGLRSQLCNQDVADQALSIQEGKYNQELKEVSEVNEGVTSLLLLADGKQQYADRNARGVNTVAQMERESEELRRRDRQDLSTSSSLEKDTVLNLPRSIKPSNQLFQSADSEEAKQYYTPLLQSADNEGAKQIYNEDDKDGPLVIIDNDSQVAGLEGAIPVDNTSSSLDTQVLQLEDGVEVIYQSSLECDKLDKEEEKQGNIPKSRSRSESQKKMEEGKHWLINNLMVVAGSLSVIKLSDIEKSYLSYCEKNGKEALVTPVLARLIHILFPQGEKCRLGARGNQRIHYRNLRFKDEVLSTLNHQSSELHRDSPVQDQTSSLKTQNKPQAKPNLDVEHDSKRADCANQQQSLDQSKACEKALGFRGKDLDGSELLSEENEETQDQQMLNMPNQDDEEGCKAAAKKLNEVLKWITSQGVEHRRALLRDFAHSASCQKPRCVPVCLMFRRVRRHVVAAQHSCSVLRLYSMLLRHHVSSCTQQKCGLPACPALRATRPCKRSLDHQHQPAKRAAITQASGLYRPSSLVLAPRSPLGSLPGSPVNSPPSSPESSPGRSNVTVPPGQVQYVMVMMPVVENHGA